MIEQKIKQMCADVLQIPYLGTQTFPQKDQDNRVMGSITINHWWLATLSEKNILRQTTTTTVCCVHTDQGLKGLIVLTSPQFSDGYYVPEGILNLSESQDMISEQLRSVNLLHYDPQVEKQITSDSVVFSIQTRSIYSSIVLETPLKKESSWRDIYITLLQKLLDFRKIYNDETINEFVNPVFINARIESQKLENTQSTLSSDDDVNSGVW